MSEERRRLKGEDYLTKRGHKIFDAIVKHVEENNLSMEIDIYLLSILSNELEKYQLASELANKKSDLKGYINVYQNGNVQANGYSSLIKSSLDQILKIGPLFGLSPADRQKIMKSTTKKRRKLDLD